jgi:hypothetical protein
MGGIVVEERKINRALFKFDDLLNKFNMIGHFETGWRKKTKKKKKSQKE